MFRGSNGNLLSRPALALSTFLSLIGFTLFLLVILGVPIINTIAFTTLRADTSGTTLSTGVFGVCYRVGLGTSFSGPYSGTAYDINPNAPTPPYREPTQMCQRLGLGWDARISHDTRNVTSRRFAPVAFTRALVVNVLVAALAGVGILGLVGSTVEPRGKAVAPTLGLTALAALLAWIAFFIDIAFSATTRDRLSGFTDTWTVKLGNVNWLALGGALAITLSLLVGWYSYQQTRQSGPRFEAGKGADLHKTATGE